MILKRDIDFEFGDIVFLITDDDQRERMVTSIIVGPSSIMYELTCGIHTSEHYAIEISADKRY